MHIVIIDDEQILSKTIRTQLLKHDYTVSLISSYQNFLTTSISEKTDLFLVDISLWDGTGFDVMKVLKSKREFKSTPVIFISWHSDTKTKVTWLDLGADDYIVKPFNTNELLARIRKSLRIKKIHYDSEIIYNNLIFDAYSRRVSVDNQEVSLSRKEKQILEFFLLHPQKCVSKIDLEEKFWWEKAFKKNIGNTINVTICKLRKKLWPNFKLETIVWEWYCLS